MLQRPNIRPKTNFSYWILESNQLTPQVLRENYFEHKTSCSGRKQNNLGNKKEGTKEQVIQDIADLILRL